MTAPAAAAAAPPRSPAAPSSPAQVAGGRHNEGHGRRLTAAFEALEAFPALAESRNRLLRVVGQERVSAAEVVAAVESDVALVIAVLRLANQVEGRTRGRVESIVKAVELLSPEAVQALAARARTFDFFERSALVGRGARALPPARRRHPARRRPPGHRDRLRRARPPDGHGAAARHRQARPDARLPGLSGPGPRPGPHAGGAHPPRAPRARRRPRAGRRRAGPPLGPAQGRRPARSSATTPTTPTGEAAFVRLADMLAHYAQGGAVSPTELLKVARVDRARAPASCARSCTTCPTRRPAATARSTRARCRPASSRCSSAWPRARSTSRSPSSSTLSTITVRTHLHNIYGKLGAVDRAQAVLLATERGWL